MKLIASSHSPRAAFTLVEIAICLAIIGVALVGIIGILPLGMNTQRDTREGTIIAQDVATLLPMITHGARGSDDLTNYIYAITNTWTQYSVDGNPTGNGGVDGYSVDGAYAAAPYSSSFRLTNNANIIGLLSTPEFVADTTNYNYPAVPNIFYTNYDNAYVYSNHIVACVRSFSGLAAEKPPQNNDILLSDTFSYKIYVVNASIAYDTNTTDGASISEFNNQLARNQRELRMTYYWPLLPNGKVPNYGSSPQTFRATVAGQLARTNILGQPLYFYQPQSFAAAPDIRSK